MEIEKTDPCLCLVFHPQAFNLLKSGNAKNRPAEKSFETTGKGVFT